MAVVRQTCERAVASHVVSDEAGGEHQQNHEQLEPGKSTTLHLHLQVLRRQQREGAVSTFRTGLDDPPESNLTQAVAVLEVLGPSSVSHLFVGDSERLDRFLQVLPKLNIKTKHVH